MSTSPYYMDGSPWKMDGPPSITIHDTWAPMDSHLEPLDIGDFTANRRMIFIAVIAIAVGVIATFVASFLLELIALFTNLFYFQRFSIDAASPANNHLGAASVVVPILGALIIGLMARYGSERIRGHGIPEALEAILTRGSRIQGRVALLKPLSSAISIGSGGPFGAEGPIIMTGGAFGSLIAQTFSLTSAERKTLLVAGAAAGMSATFAAPLAAILLAVELLLFEWKPRSFVPVALASATAAAARYFVIGAGPLFPMPAHPAFAGVDVLGCCAISGLVAGAFSGLLTLAVYAWEDAFKRLTIHWMWWPAIGGLAIGLGGLLCPQALGVGYDVIGGILANGYTVRAIVVLVLVKGVIWSVSLGSGTSGGVLAPLLMMGGALGALEGFVFPEAGLGFWALVSMGAILGGTMRSPLTGIIFAVELTHDMNMFLPLVIAVTIAHAFTVLALRRSILTEKVARRGFHVSREYAIDELEILFVRDVMRTDIVVLRAEGTLHEALGDVEPARDERSQQVYPILDDDANLVGSATRPEIAQWSATPGNLDQPLGSLATPPQTVRSNETLRAAVQRMAEEGVTRLLVVNPASPRHLVGKIALHDLLKARARHLEDEQRRERVLPWEYILPPWIRPKQKRT
ncbi:MAG: domain containing protein [Myxococcales bacterium]|nr:domain containing protein [Myxococcales bacterium]